MGRVSATVPEFMHAARSVLVQGISEQTLSEVGRLLSQVSQLPGFAPEAKLRNMHGSESTAAVLQSDSDGLTLVLGLFSSKAETPVHDHGSWGVACVARGRDRYRHWERRDDGADPGRADVQMLFEKELGPGDWISWLDPPADIHSQQGIGEAALELVLFGKNVMALPRHYFEIATGKVTSALPQ